MPVAVLIGTQAGKLGADEREAEGPHEVAVFGIWMAVVGWVGAMVTMLLVKFPGQSDVEPLPPTTLNDFFPFRWLFSWRYMRLALALGCLQFGHEAFFQLTPAHMFQVFSDKDYFDDGDFISNVLSTGAGMVFVGLVLMPPVVKSGLGLGDKAVALAGIGSAFMNYWSWGLALDRTGVYMAQIVGFGVLCAKPALSALVSDMMGPVHASEAIGGLFSIGHLGSIIGVAAGAKMFHSIGQPSYFVMALGPLVAAALLMSPSGRVRK